jgi:acetyl esterase/lipase
MWIFPRIRLTFTVLALALACCSSLAETNFYVPQAGAVAAAPGTVIRQQEIVGAPEGATAYRILYTSTGLDGHSIAVSGVVIVPQGQAPAGGWPVIAWAHPTTGVVPRCAPSEAIFLFQQIQGLREMMRGGYVVAATDYPGLGTAGPHPYLVGASEARAVLDSVRAARSFGGSSKFAVWGHSQGGQAALFAGLISAAYSPDLTLVGVAAAAPATDLGTLMRDDFNSVGGRNITAMTLWSWSRVFGLSLDHVVDPAAMPVVDQLAGECIESLYDLVERQRTGAPLAQRFLLVKNLDDVAAWHDVLVQNEPAPLPPSIPVFLAQGSADLLVRPAVTHAYMNQLCKGGSKVRMILLPGVGHGFAAHDSAAAAVRWIGDRFEGKAVPSDCGG